MKNPLTEVHLPCDMGTYLSSPVDDQCLGDNYVGEDEESLKVPTPVKYPLPLLWYDGHKVASQFSLGHGISYCQLYDHLEPTMLPHTVTRNSYIQMQLTIVV